MEDAPKKISFGFSKLKKTSQLVKPVEVEKKEIEYVDSFDGDRGKFSYLGAVREEEVKKPLVIPLIGTKSAYDVIKAKLEITEPKTEEDPPKIDIPIKTEPQDETTSVNQQVNETVDVKPSLEVLAAQELLKDLKEEGETKESSKNFVIVPDLEKPTFVGEKESTLEDYENIPVNDFGLALLRGMGWTPDTGIGKESRVVETVTAKVRPKRLGLGAEGALLPPGEKLPLKKGSLVQVIAGQLKNRVGVIEGVDGDTGSVFVKIEGNGNLSLSENIVKVITKKEFEAALNGSAKNGETESRRVPEKKYGISEKVKSEAPIKTTSTSMLQKNLPSSYRGRSQSRSPQRRIKRQDRSDSEDSYKRQRSRSQDKKTRRSRSREKTKKKKNRRSSNSEESSRKKKKSRRSSSSEDSYKKKKKSRRSSSSEDSYKKKKKSSRSSSSDDSSRRKNRKKEKRSHRDYDKDSRRKRDYDR